MYSFRRKFSADGVVQDSRGEVTRIYEFYGCWYHGCPEADCFGSCQQAKWCGGEETFADKFEASLSRMNLIRGAYPDAVIYELWSHDLEALLSSTSPDPDFQGPLNPRMALYGGRVEVCNMLGHSADPATAAAYIDVVSMYPSVQHTSKYPIGEMEVLRNHTVADMTRSDGSFFMPWFGVMQIKLLATRRLSHAPVPFRTADKKLLFPLCGE